MSVVVRTYTISPLAHAEATWLCEHGIAASVQDENAATIDLLLPAIGYIKLTVPADQAERAEALLATLTPTTPAAADEDGPPPWTCPDCGGHDTATHHPFLWTLLVPILFPLMFIRRGYCTGCRRQVSLREARIARGG